MKIRLLILCTCILFACTYLNAQVCTNGVNTIPCTATLTNEGFTPNEDIPCFVRGHAIDTVIQFKCWNQVSYNGIPIIVDSVKIDSIEYLPIGLCWSSNDQDNVYASQEVACIRIQGITNDRAGQFKIKVCFTIYSGGSTVPVPVYENLGGKLIIRLLNFPASTCYAIDSTQTEDFQSVPNPDNISPLMCRVYKDIDNNGIYNYIEPVYSNVTIKVGNQLAMTNSQGICFINLTPGTYQVHPVLTNTDPFVMVSDTVSITVTDTVTSFFAGFIVNVSPDYCNHEFTLSPWASPPRPGFANTMRVSYTNISSAAPLSDVVRMYYESSQRVHTSIPAPTILDTVAHYLEWNVNALPLYQTWFADVAFVTSSGVALGSTITNSARVLNNPCPLFSDSIKFEALVVGSFDPNDKAVSPVGYGEQHGVNPDLEKSLTYHIRFQNTGTYMAENIIIVDTISPHLNINTLKVRRASHAYSVKIEGRAVRFLFNYIMLPDSNSNEPQSHGYIQYAIEPYTGLAQNVEIKNRADIYFDFNEPVLTNTTLTTVDYIDHTVGIKEVYSRYHFNLFPNPATGAVQITVDEQLIGKELKVSDISGRVLLQRMVDAPVMTIQLSELANGIYLIQIDGTTKKLAKE